MTIRELKEFINDLPDEADSEDIYLVDNEGRQKFAIVDVRRNYDWQDGDRYQCSILFRGEQV